MTIPKSNVLPEYEEDNKSLTVQKIQLENSLERLKETTSALSFDDIFARCEALLKEKYRLLRQLEINTIWKNTELMKQSQAEALYDTITYSVTTTNKKYLEQKQKLTDKIQMQKDLYEKYKKKFEIDGAYIAKIRMAVLHFNQLLSRVSLDDEEISTSAENVVPFTMEPPTSNPNLDPFHVNNENEPDAGDFVNVSHMLDIIILKIGLLMKQSSLRELTEEEIKEAEDLHAELIQKEVGLMKEPSKKPRPQVSGKFDIPDPKVVKKNSQRLVEQLEAKPPPPNPHDKVVKHECY